MFGGKGGMELMVENLVKSLTGLSIDQIKAAMLMAQQRVTETVDTFNSNFKFLAEQLIGHERQLKDIQLRLDGSKTGLLSAQLEELRSLVQTVHKPTHLMLGTIMRAQDSQLFHLAQISLKLGLDLTPEMLEVLTRQATGGAASKFTLPEPANHINDFEGSDGGPLPTARNGVGLDGSDPSHPFDVPPELEIHVDPSYREREQLETLEREHGRENSAAD